jgi:hypothetical protein
MKDEEHTNMSADRKERWKAACFKTGKCPLCPPHGGENARVNGKTPKPDKYKNKDRETIAEVVCEEDIPCPTTTSP